MDNKQLARRAFFLAYQASPVVGMGYFEAREGITEDQLCQDYGSEDGRLYADYAYGRMMKTSVIAEPSGVVVNYGRHPRPDYQGWGAVYPTNEKLLEAALESLTRPESVPA